MSRSSRASSPASRAVVLDRRAAPIDLTQLEPLIALIVSRWNPQAIWLFGSRARGDARASSDWDLFVVVTDDLADEDMDPAVRWKLRKDSGVRADIVPCRVSEFREDSGTPNTLAYEVATAGVLIHER